MLPNSVSFLFFRPDLRLAGFHHAVAYPRRYLPHRADGQPGSDKHWYWPASTDPLLLATQDTRGDKLMDIQLLAGVFVGIFIAGFLPWPGAEATTESRPLSLEIKI